MLWFAGWGFSLFMKLGLWKRQRELSDLMTDKIALSFLAIAKKNRSIENKQLEGRLKITLSKGGWWLSDQVCLQSLFCLVWSFFIHSLVSHSPGPWGPLTLWPILVQNGFGKARFVTWFLRVIQMKEWQSLNHTTGLLLSINPDGWLLLFLQLWVTLKSWTCSYQNFYPI